MISVVIPLYNKEASIKQSLMSVLSQTYQNYELIIVNDGSKDNSALICKEYINRDKVIYFEKINKIGCLSNLVDE